MVKAAMLWRRQDLLWKIDALMARKQREWQRLLNRKQRIYKKGA
jgi:hypothetical protein